MKLTDLIPYAADDNVRAFLRVLREGESSQTDDAYRMRFGGELVDPGLIWHPGGTVKRLINGKAIESSAAGAYQFLARTWESVAHEIGLANFGPASQDLAAIYLIARRGALPDVVAGRLDDAIRRCSGEWASLPDSPYGQPTLTFERARAVYERWGGRYGPATSAPASTVEPLAPAPPSPDLQAADPIPTPSESGVDLAPRRSASVAPLIAAAISTIIQAAPTLIRAFGNGEQAQKNAKIADVIADIATKATGTTDVVAAAQRVVADPSAAQAIEAAAQERFYELTEVGGGIQAARGFVVALLGSGPEWQRVASAVFVGVLSLAIVGGGGAMMWSLLHDPSVSGEQRAMLIGAAIALINAPVAWWFGSSASSRRKDDALSAK